MDSNYFHVVAQVAVLGSECSEEVGQVTEVTEHYVYVDTQDRAGNNISLNFPQYSEKAPPQSFKGLYS